MPDTEHKGWHNRGYLPHYDKAGLYQMITYRLADSLPQAVYKRLKESLADSEFRKKTEATLDNGLGSCILSNPNVADIVLSAWKHWDEERYQLIAWTIMPNHVHLLINQHEGYQLGNLVRSWKSFTGRKINNLLSKTGSVWAKDYWDRFIRDEAHFSNAVNYIMNNPVKAKLVVNAEDWLWSGVKT